MLRILQQSQGFKILNKSSHWCKTVDVELFSQELGFVCTGAYQSIGILNIRSDSAIAV